MKNWYKRSLKKDETLGVKILSFIIDFANLTCINIYFGDRRVTVFPFPISPYSFKIHFYFLTPL